MIRNCLLFIRTFFILIFTLLVPGLFKTSHVYAATEFVNIIDPDNGAGTDYTSLSSWETAIEVDLTAAGTKVFSHGGITGSIADGSTVTGATSLATGVVKHVTSTQIMLRSISGTFQSGEQVYRVQNSHYVTISNSGDSAIAVAKARSTSGTADTTVSISGWTTSSTNYIKIMTDPSDGTRHSGKWDDTKYRLVNSGEAAVISPSSGNVWIDGLQIKYGSDAGEWRGCINSNASGFIKFSNNICTRNDWTSGGPLNGVDFWGSGTYYVWNNIVYNFKGSGSALWLNGGTGYYYNNTVYDNNIGINKWSGTLYAKNNLAQNNTDGYSGSFHADSDYNLSDLDADAPGGNSKNLTSVNFVDATNKDFHLATSDTGAKDAGTDLSADVIQFSTDIDNNTRSGSWDIGADEYVLTLTQSAYRWFNNNNSADVGSALAVQDTAVTTPLQGTAFRLRLLLHIADAQLGTSGQAFKLQFAERSGTCDTSFSGETYGDVSPSSGAIRFYNNTTPSDGDDLTDNASDPAHSGHSNINQDYEESNNFTNSVAAISSGQDGLWDFSLVDFSAVHNTSYCFRAVKSDDSLLDTYSVIPEITTYADTAAPSISLTALSPDPNNDTTPALTGTATEAIGTVSNVQFQMDSTAGSWTACTADDAAFDEASEAFTCTVSAALSDGSHTMYVRATDSNSNTTAGGSESSDTFTIDATAPSVSLTALTPDPNNDTTPTLSGTATDATTVLTAIQFQMDGTGGAWSSCTADDGAIDETSEAFTCTPSAALTDGAHTIYVRATDSASNTTALANYGTDTFTVDSGGPTVTLTVYTPDPTTDSTPTISGSATDITGTVSTVQFQVDSTTGSWSSCTADDSTFDEATETFTCTITTALTDGSHTIYVRATDNASNISSNASDSFTVDTTTPNSFDLSEPSDKEYISSERPAFKWKIASTPDATSGIVNYKVEVDNGDSGDFTIDHIPPSRTTDYENDKYIVHYDNFSDSDSSNNYIYVVTKSSTKWTSSENDGKLKEGKRSWKVIAIDQAGNTREVSRTLFVDKSGPSIEVTQVNDVSSTSGESSSATPEVSFALSTTDTTPTIYGKITDPLTGDPSVNSGQANKVASGPKEIEVDIQKKNSFGIYETYSLSSISLTENYWTSTGGKIGDNNQNTSSKYSPFSFTSSLSLPYGDYQIVLKGKDKAGNTGGEETFLLTIGTPSTILTPEEQEEIEKTIEETVPPETSKEEKEITKPLPTPTKSPSVSLTTGVVRTVQNLYWGVVGVGKKIARLLPQGVKNFLALVTTPLRHPVFTAFKIKLARTYEVWFNNEKTRIFAVKVQPAGTTAIITWKTNHYTFNNAVNYGTNRSYGKKTWSPDWQKEHQVKITHLTPDTHYVFEVMSQGKNYVFDARYEFTTLAK